MAGKLAAAAFASAVLSVPPVHAYGHYPIEVVPAPLKANLAIAIVIILFAAALLIITHEKKKG